MRRFIFALGVLLLLSACNVPTQATPRNAALLQSAQKGALASPSFVEFYSDECASCRKIQGPLLALDERYTPRVQFIYIDIDQDFAEPFMAQYNVRGAPTFVLLDQRGQVVENIAGWSGDQAMTDALDRLTARP